MEKIVKVDRYLCSIVNNEISFPTGKKGAQAKYFLLNF